MQNPVIGPWSFDHHAAPVASLKGLIVALPISGALWAVLIAGTNAIL